MNNLVSLTEITFVTITGKLGTDGRAGDCEFPCARSCSEWRIHRKMDRNESIQWRIVHGTKADQRPFSSFDLPDAGDGLEHCWHAFFCRILFQWLCSVM